LQFPEAVAASRNFGGDRKMAVESLYETYRRAADHWVECPICTSAGGDRADAYDLCPAGRVLLLTCEDAEKSWLVESTDAYGV
jgi:hypothetical protein